MKPIKDIQLYNDLQAVEALLIEEGWCKHTTRDSEGQRCLRGAIDAVTYGTTTRSMSRWINIQSALGTHLLATWNDLPGTTFDDVLAKLRAARAALVE